MAETVWIGAALLCALAGMAWLALAMPVHWRQVRVQDSLEPGAQRMLRAAAGGALVSSLLLCLRADHATIAVLVWVMSLSVCALAVAFALAWRPRALAWLVAWMPRVRS